MKTDDGAGARNCPQCGKPLEKVRYPSDSMLNRDQWESVRAGDWWCKSCPYNGRAKNPIGAYFWDSEVAERGEVGSVPERKSPCCGNAMSDNTAFYVCVCGKRWVPKMLSQPTEWEEVKLTTNAKENHFTVQDCFIYGGEVGSVGQGEPASVAPSVEELEEVCRFCKEAIEAVRGSGWRWTHRATQNMACASGSHLATPSSDKSFETWWDEHGRFIDPEPNVDWYDKRQELAALAFRAALERKQSQ